MYSFLRWWIVSCEFSCGKFVDICRLVQGVGVVSLWRGPTVRKHLVYGISNICQLCFNLGEWRHAILVSFYIYIYLYVPDLVEGKFTGTPISHILRVTWWPTDIGPGPCQPGPATALWRILSSMMWLGLARGSLPSRHELVEHLTIEMAN